MCVYVHTQVSQSHQTTTQSPPSPPPRTTSSYIIKYGQEFFFLFVSKTLNCPNKQGLLVFFNQRPYLGRGDLGVIPPRVEPLGGDCGHVQSLVVALNLDTAPLGVDGVAPPDEAGARPLDREEHDDGADGNTRGPGSRQDIVVL